MAIAFRSASSYTDDWDIYDAYVKLPKPAGLVTGDVMVCLIEMSKTNSMVVVPTGWLLLDTWTASTGVRLYSYVKTATAFETTTYDFKTASDNSTSTGTLMAFSGVNLSGRVRDHKTAAAAMSLTLESPALAGTQSTDMVVLLGGARPEGSHSTSVITAPTGSWTSPAAAAAGPSVYTSYPGSSDSSYLINGTTGQFTTPYQSGIGVTAISLIPDTVDTTPPATTHNLTTTSTTPTQINAGLTIVGKPPAAPYYEFFIDWDRDNGLRVSDFETDFDGWLPDDLLALSTERSYSGDASLKATWRAAPVNANPASTFKFDDGAHGFDTGTFAVTSTDPVDDSILSITYSFTGLVVASTYTFSVWVWVPSTGGQHVKIGVRGLATSTATSTTDGWVQKSVTFTPTDTTHELFVDASGTVTTGNVTYLDYAFVQGAFENVTSRVRGTEAITWSYGRDQSRALSPSTPAETEISLDNQDGQLASNNTGSALHDYLLPNRELLIRVTYDGMVYDLFRGYTDDITENPYLEEQEVTISAVDPLASVAGGQLSTQVWMGLRTGDAIHKVLDEIGWPAARRDIDPGATVLAHFWVEGKDASDAISDIVASEGPPAFATVSNAGYFIFRDRHHRILSQRSSEPQVNFNATGQEPCFSPPAEINIGWKDIINSVSLSVITRTPVTGLAESDSSTDNEDNTSNNLRVSINPPVVWSSPDTISIPAGESVTLKVTSDKPVLAFTLPDIVHEDVIVAGGPVEMSLSRTSGQSTDLTIHAPSTDIAITDLKVRGYPLEDQDGVVVNVTDANSVAAVGQKADPENIDTPWANANDALAIGQIITRTRGRRLPTMSITIKAGVTLPERLKEIFTRQLSDLIHIVEPRSFTDHDFFIESIDHEIDLAGKMHIIKLGCEAVPTIIESVDEAVNPFTFDDPYNGFDSGVFAYDTIQSNPDDVFILDVSKLDEDGLGF